jgi:tetratricopeptide (TPR) repeat protein
MSFYFRQPENDYIQLAAEAGLAGVALALWFGAVVWRKCRVAAARLSARRWPLFAALGAGITGGLVHEFFDFSLHTPANALLFCVLLAALLRLALTYRMDRPALGLRSVTSPSAYTYLKAGLAAAGAAVMIVAAQIQHNASYPYDIGSPRTFARAEAAAVSHPADSEVHLALAALMPPGAPAALRNQELHAAVWLNPNDPLARDVYARDLFLAGKVREGLAELKLSVFHAPDIDSHYYLQPRSIVWLLPAEQRAIYEGFGEAIAAGYEGSARGLAQFYRELGRYTEAAEVSAKAAAAASNDGARMEYLLAAGRDYAMAQNLPEAQRQLRAAIAIDPTDARPYCAMMVAVLGPEHDIKGAKDLAQEAYTNGAEPVPIEQALAQAARTAGDLDTAAAALTQVTRDEPTLASTIELGDFYSESGNYNEATKVFQQATEIDPGSARAYFSLGRAEEASFDYADASRDYERARQLAPDDEAIQSAYLDLKQRAAKFHDQSSSDK